MRPDPSLKGKGHGKDENQVSAMPQAIFFACAFLLNDLFSLAFRYLDWGKGLDRLLLLVVIAAFLIATRKIKITISLPRKFTYFIYAALGILFLGYIGLIGYSVVSTAKTGVIRLDQGEATFRAAIELLRGHNPYAKGALLDQATYFYLLQKRVQLGVGPAVPPPQVQSVFDAYWRTLNPALRTLLLPAPPPNNPAAALQTRILGYRYGLVILAISTVLVPTFGPAAIPLENAILTLGLLAIMIWILRLRHLEKPVIALALLGVMLDVQIPWNFIYFTATDIWAIFFGFLAVGCLLNKKEPLAGIFFAASVCSKIFPGLIFAVVMLRFVSFRLLKYFFITLFILITPWLIWDTSGFLSNAILFPFYMPLDSTSWSAFVPFKLSIIMHILLLLCAVYLISKIIFSQEKRWFYLMSLLTITVAAAAGEFHNNYVPWFSIWTVLSMTDWCGREDLNLQGVAPTSS